MLTELEAVRACVIAMDLSFHEVSLNAPEHTIRLEGGIAYWPITNDRQMVGLIKKFGLSLAKAPGSPWAVALGNQPSSYDEDLNLAVVKCIAKAFGARITP